MRRKPSPQGQLEWRLLKTGIERLVYLCKLGQQEQQSKKKIRTRKKTQTYVCEEEGKRRMKPTINDQGAAVERPRSRNAEAGKGPFLKVLSSP